MLITNNLNKFCKNFVNLTKQITICNVAWTGKLIYSPHHLKAVQYYFILIKNQSIAKQKL